MKRTITPSFQRRIGIFGAVVYALVGGVMSASASTIAYWPLAGENGVRTTVSDIFSNSAHPGVMEARPLTIKNATKCV